MTTATLRKTPLTALHEAAGARLVDFAGFLMPVQYEGILEEAKRVRTKAGTFDLCHMGRCRITGARREEAAQFLVHVNIEKMRFGQIRYTFFCRDDGTTMDDVLVYRDTDEMFFCINAGNRARDIAWMKEVSAKFGCTFEDLSDELAMIAIQGPRSADTMAPLCSGDLRGLKYYWFYRGTVCGVPAMISRTGYTGEDGFEIVGEDAAIWEAWNGVLSKGATFGLKPCGLGARDTLRTEVCYPLYGHELDENTTPIEAGVGFFVSLDKGEFIGRSVLAEQKANGTNKKCIAFKMTEKAAPPRPGYPIWVNGVSVGQVVSGTQSPSLGIGIGLGYVPTEFAKAGTTIEIEARGRRAAAEIVAKPIYKARAST